MKLKPALLIAFLAIFMLACEEEEPPPADPGATINGKEFAADYIWITRLGDGLQITMAAGSQSIDIISIDTIAGRYLFQEEQFKATVVYPAILIYQDGADDYLGTSGKLDLVLDGDHYSGTFESMVQSDEGERVEIREGLFTDVELKPAS
jgi:hypothetical protein